MTGVWGLLSSSLPPAEYAGGKRQKILDQETDGSMFWLNADVKKGGRSNESHPYASSIVEHTGITGRERRRHGYSRCLGLGARGTSSCDGFFYAFWEASVVVAFVSV